MFKSLSLLLTSALGMCAQIAQCQTLSESILARWQTYIFVSTEMPRSQLETLARDSLNTRTTLVFNGFGRGGQAAIQNYVFQVNQSCCLGKASFAIDPVLTSKYKVTSVPTFLLAVGTSTLPTEYSMMSGDMQWANAIKYWAQESKSAQIRQEATHLYSIYSR
jgi:conjugal transfer pilus assembly protein TrbC